MGSSSRPHRQARSVRSYKDSYSDDDDFSKAHCTTTPSIHSRKNLALKRTSRSQERPNAKERAEAVQLQRAIDESLSKDTSEAKKASLQNSDRSSPAKDVVDSEDEVANVTRRDSVAFQCLLDVASDAGLENSVRTCQEAAATLLVEGGAQEAKKESMPSDRTVHDREASKQAAVHHVNRSESSDDKDKTKAAIQDDDDWSFGEEEEEDNDDDSEDESSDVSEDSGCKRKKLINSQQKGQITCKKQVKDHTLAVPVKKGRSSRHVSKSKAEQKNYHFRTATSECKQTLSRVKVPDGKENVPTIHIAQTEVAKKHVVNFNGAKGSGTGALTAKRFETVEESRRSCFSKTSVVNDASCESLGILKFQAQSPTLVHRRVIGLSRRFRPPPLHPYLSRTDG